jgi:hypothetical protein
MFGDLQIAIKTWPPGQRANLRCYLAFIGILVTDRPRP